MISVLFLHMFRSDKLSLLLEVVSVAVEVVIVVVVVVGGGGGGEKEDIIPFRKPVTAKTPFFFHFYAISGTALNYL